MSHILLAACDDAAAVGQSDPHPLIADVERLTWHDSDRRMMGRVSDFISRGIAAATTFDESCRRVLDLAVEAKGLSTRKTGPRPRDPDQRRTADPRAHH